MCFELKFVEISCSPKENAKTFKRTKLKKKKNLEILKKK